MSGPWVTILTFCGYAPFHGPRKYLHEKTFLTASECNEFVKQLNFEYGEKKAP